MRRDRRGRYCVGTSSTRLGLCTVVSGEVGLMSVYVRSGRLMSGRIGEVGIVSGRVQRGMFIIEK